MSIHYIEPQAETLHGCFSHELPPVLIVEPGDTVRFRTLDARWRLEAPYSFIDPPDRVDRLPGHTPRHPGRDDGHALCGPVSVRGARPGMMLAVHIQRIVPGSWGWTLPYDTAGPGEEVPLIWWELDALRMVGHSTLGRSVALRPFMGVMGLAPAEPGILSTTPPRAQGGNLDCKELVAGSTLYLPVAVPGALFSVGDGHAAQGDGEAGGTAIECPMELVELSFELAEEPLIPTLHARTPAGWLTFGLDEDLDRAVDAALQAMAGLMGALYGLRPLEAVGLAAAAVDLRITQIVNQTKGAHALLPHGAVR